MTYANADPKKKVTLLKGKAYSKFKVAIWIEAGGRCVCGKFVPLRDPDGAFDIFTCAHLSHKTPRRRGGDVPQNVQILCFDCHIANGHLKWRSDKNERGGK